MLVPFFLRVFLPSLMLLDRLRKLAHEIGQTLGGLFGAFRVLLRRQAPFGRGNRQLIIRALDHDAPIPLAEPFEIKAVGHVLRWFLVPIHHLERFRHRHVEDPDFS